MNMVGMNAGAPGGPVGGMVMMNNGSPASSSNVTSQQQQKEHLNTCIYDYFLKLGYIDLARALTSDPKFSRELRLKPRMKQSPGRRKEGEMNGEVDGMDMDVKDDIPEDMQRPNLPSNESHGNGFLFDWFCIFSDVFSAQRSKVQGDSSAARQYFMQTQNMQRMRESQQNQNLPRPGMAGPQFAAIRGMRNGVMNGDMQKAAMAKALTPAQMQQIQQQRMFQQQQMQREHSDMDMNGRPPTPAEGENGGSPSKRPRIDGQQFNGGVGPNGRPQGMPGVQQQMLMQSGFNPNQLNPAQFRQNGAMQQKAMQGQMSNGMMNMANAGSPMLAPMSDAQFANGVPGMDMYSQRMPGQALPGGAGAQGGNHALQDYQMQLMLLEQQNKKRLMMARQEQDNITSRSDGPQLPGQAGIPQGMSPSARSGTSPNPTDQMKRGTPQLGGLPGSPAGGEIMQGRSPAAMNFMTNGMNPDFNPNMFMKQNEGMVGPGPGMRPPNTMDMGAMGGMARSQQGRMPGQFPGGQPMVQQGSQGQPQPMGTPGQRTEMPPPSAPAAGNVNAQRPQPTSPQQNQAPPTPSQSNKGNPKKKGKDGGDTRKKPNKKNSTANAPADAEPPATPTPSVPISPQNPNSFNNSAGKAGPGAAPNAGPTSNPMPQPMQPDMQNPAFSDFVGAPEQQFNLDFSTLETGDVLENFDFDSFLNTNGDDTFNFGDSMTDFGPVGGVEDL